MKHFFDNTKLKRLWALRISQLIRWSKKFTLPGFNEVPLYDILVFIYAEVKKDDLPTRANSVAFSFFISIFPFIIFVLPILSSTPWAEQSISQLSDSMEGVLPANAAAYIIDMIEGINNDGSFSLQSIGFVLSMIFASSGMLTLMYGFDKTHSISFKSRSYFKKRFVALNLTILFAIILFVSILLVIAGKRLVHIMGETLEISWVESTMVFGLKWLIVIFLFYSVITVIYRYGPSIYRPLKLINPGATLATLASILCSVGFSYFINNFGRYNEIYGSIGALIVILLWFQINAFIILAGFELNASIIVNRDAKNQELINQSS